jgi:uncharacterized protein YgbK (DUF1537 family)
MHPPLGGSPSPSATATGLQRRSTLPVSAIAGQLTPGFPLSTMHSDGAAFGGLQVALKGGRIGMPDYYVAIRVGRR